MPLCCDIMYSNLRDHYVHSSHESIVSFSCSVFFYKTIPLSHVAPYLSLSICLSICLSGYLLICLSTCLSIYLIFYLSSPSLSLYMYVSPSVALSLLLKYVPCLANMTLSFCVWLALLSIRLRRSSGFSPKMPSNAGSILWLKQKKTRLR